MAGPESPERPRPRGTRVRRILVGVSSCLIILYLFLMLTGRALPVPGALQTEIEARLNAGLAGSEIGLGGMAITVGRDGVPRVRLTDLALGSAAAGAVAVLNEMEARLSPERLLRGEIAASQLSFLGAQVTIRRTADGAFAFASGQGGGQAQSVPDVLALIDEVFETPQLAPLETVRAAGIVISLEDARSGRIWQATNATAILKRDDVGKTLTLVSDVFNGTDQVAEVEMSLKRNLSTGGASVGASLSGMPAADIALQSPALSWLGVLDTALSGSVRAEIAEDGALTALAGTLDLEAGALQPVPDAPPLAFSSAEIYFLFDPDAGRIDFSELSVEAERGRLRASGHTYLTELDGPWPEAFVGQFTIEEAAFDGEGVFEAPFALSGLRVDMRLRLDPFTVDIGQMTFSEEEAEIVARGRVTADDAGWHVAVDAETDVIRSDRVLRYWPKPTSPITRGWLSENLKEGVLRNVSAGLRFQTDRKPDAILSFDFEDGKVQFLSDMPLLTGAAGRATLVNKAFSLKVEKGQVDVGAPGILDAAGSVFSVPDTRPKPVIGEIDLVASGPLEAALTVLNRDPLRIMDRAGRSPDFVEAMATARARVALPLTRKIDGDAVRYSVSAELTDVTSDQIAEGRVLAARRLEFSADEEALQLRGRITLDGVPAETAWKQPLSKGASGQVRGTVALTPETLAALDVPLPDGVMSGRGLGRFRLELPKDGAPRLELTSDLRGLRLGIPGLDWTKPAGVTGAFGLAAVLGDVPQVETLALSAPGLSLDGTIELGADGTFLGAEFGEVALGDWLSGKVTIVPRGADRAPAIELAEARLDLRSLPEGGAGGGDGAPITLSLNELVVTDSLRLSPMTGTFLQGRAGLSGRFRGRVNGGAAVIGTIAPANGGTALRIQGEDAGAVIRDAGLTPNAESGSLNLVMAPVEGARRGTYDGQFRIEDIRLRKAPALADLLDAVSVVGLIDQLAGPGILFNTVDGSFRLTPNQLVLREAAAVGGSLGISADGVYDMRQKKLDFQGVVSPVYFLNGIGAAVSRRGEGLFGFNYRVAGSTEEPSVAVNPLSVLAPGFLRNIFRRQARSQ